MKRILIYILSIVILTGCTQEEPQPECDLPEFTFQENIYQTNHVRDNGHVYERWCGDRFIRGIIATEEAMHKEGCETGMEVGGRWECQAGHSTSHSELFVVCDCVTPAEPELIGPQQ